MFKITKYRFYNIVQDRGTTYIYYLLECSECEKRTDEKFHWCCSCRVTENGQERIYFLMLIVAEIAASGLLSNLFKIANAVVRIGIFFNFMSLV